MSENSISLGDAIRRLSLHVHTDLQNTLLLMRGQDPELRTTELRQYISRSRRKLLQLYALSKWLSSAGITQCFRAIADFNGQLTTIDQETARNLDEMYFCHAGIFTMRSRPYEVPLAVDIIAKRTYPSLPSSMFSCGKPDFPQAMNLETVRRDLDVYLRAKISVSDSLPGQDSLSVVVSGGVLKLEVAHYFVLYLTLSRLSEDAAWLVLNCRILSEPISGTSEAKSAAKAIAATEKELLQALRKIASDSDSVGGNGGGLKAMVEHCRSAALDSSIQVLAQELEVPALIASNFAGVYSSALRTDQIRKDSLLAVKIWTSTFHREPQFELRLWKTTSGSTAHGAASLSAAIYTRLTYRSPTLVFASESRQFPIPGIPDVLCGEGYVRSGCDAARLVRDTLAVLAHCRLRVLLSRLAGTMERLPAHLTSAVSITHKGAAVEVHHLAAEACVRISVDARTGKLLVDATDLREVNGSGKKALELFIAEINNLDAENYCSDFLLKHGIQGTAEESAEATHQFAKIALLPLPLTTLDELLGLFELHILATAVSTAFSVEVRDTSSVCLPSVAPVLLPACGLGSSGLIYNLSFWEDTTEASRTLESHSAYQAVFPYSHSSVDKSTLGSVATSAALPVRRSAAKKRGFSEAALESSVPGGFISAGQLAAEESAVESARYPSLKSEKAIFAVYFIITPPNPDGEITAATCLCRIATKIVGSAVESSAPVVLQHRTLRKITLRSANGSYTAPDFAEDVKEARHWAEGFITRPLSLPDLGFGSPSSTSSSSADLLVHGEDGLLVCRLPFHGVSSAEVLEVTHYHGVQDPSRLRSAWKAQPNSLRGHMRGVCSQGDLLDLAQPLLSQSVSFRRREDGDLDIVSAGTSWLATDHTAENAHCVGVFAVRLVETLLGRWPVPAASAGNAKADLFKRLNFAHSLVSLLRACTNFEGREESAAGATASGVALRPVHFAVTPGPSTANSCKCTVSMVFAVELQSSPDTSKGEARTASAAVPVARGLGRYLGVDADYLSSTMRGMGKSVNTEEICEVTLRDVVPQRFSERRMAQELLAEDNAVLRQILSDFLTK